VSADSICIVEVRGIHTFTADNVKSEAVQFKKNINHTMCYVSTHEVTIIQ